MKIGILGSTSQIAKDLIFLFLTNTENNLHLFARRPDDVRNWLNNTGLSDRYLIDDFSAFGIQEFDVIINFVGVGNPEKAAAMGASIFDVTLQYDELALNYLREHPVCRYIFLSSGAAYGPNFDEPVNAETKAIVDINKLQPQDWYGISKFHAECRHRSLPHLSIVDLRVFNYFSHMQDLEAKFFITDIVRAIRDKAVLKISDDYMVRDYIGPADFYQLVNKILTSPATNIAVDCYSKSPIDKITLIEIMHFKFGLRYELVKIADTVNATGIKSNYYSLNKRAENFGYQPILSSADVIQTECQFMLNKINHT
jgi:nucleoside-diphosphate-sugar epimerase